MNTYMGLVLDPDTCLQKGLKKEKLGNITLLATSSTEQLSASLRSGTGDFIILDMQLPKGISALALIPELRKQKPDIPVLLVTATALTEEDWHLAASQRLLEVVQTPMTAAQLHFYVSRLFQPSEKFRESRTHEVMAKPVKELRNKTGRIDAVLVAKVFDLNMTEISANVGISRQALAKTPDSSGAQPKLQHFERIARALITMNGSVKDFKMWLNCPNPEFENHTPLDVIKLGEAQMLADWIDDARLGSPD